MHTAIAVLVHPEVDADCAPKLSELQKKRLRKTAQHLDLFRNGGEVAVIAGPTVRDTSYVKMLAAHFMIKEDEIAECEALLRVEAVNIEDCCVCVDDFLDSRFGLVIVLAEEIVAQPLADTLATRTGISVGEIRLPDTLHAYVLWHT